MKASNQTKEISCRITKTLLMYVREMNHGVLGNFLEGLSHDEAYLSDTNNWVSHEFLQILYKRMVRLLDNEGAVYEMTLAAERFKSLGILDRIVRLIGHPRLVYAQAPKYNKLLKLNGIVRIHEITDTSVLLEDCYHDRMQKTRYDCDYTRGILAGIPTMFGQAPAIVEEIKCQVLPEKYTHRLWPDNPPQGCSGCFYLVRWETEKKSSTWKRMFQRKKHYHQALEDLVDANALIQAKYDEVSQLVSDLEETNKKLRVAQEILENQTNELMTSESRYRMLAENASDIIWIIRLEDLSWDYMSPSVEKVRGFTVAEAMGMSLEETLSPDSLEHVMELMALHLKYEEDPDMDPDRTVTVELEQSLKKGGYGWAEATVSFLRDTQGKATAIIGVTRDITERKQAEARLRKQLEELQKAQQEKSHLQNQLNQAQKLEAVGTLAGGIAHDFNNILSGIFGYSQLAKVHIHNPEKAVKEIDQVIKGAEKASDLVQQILTFSRNAELEKHPLAVHIVLKDVLKLLRATIPTTIRIKQDITSEAKVMANPTQIHQIVMNLCTNAYNAIGDSGGTIEISLIDTDVSEEEQNRDHAVPSGNYVKLMVKDDGCGMEREILDKIFDPYFTTNKTGKGTGLGLSVVHGIVNAHKGYIHVISEPGKGSVFSIFLPVTEHHALSSQAFQVADKIPSKGGDQMIMIVDDEESIRLSTEALLEDFGYQVKSFVDGRTALEEFKKDPKGFDLVITDMTMPYLTGLELAARLLEIRPGLPIILCTGHSDLVNQEKAGAAGIFQYVEKPLITKDLATIVQDALK